MLILTTLLLLWLSKKFFRMFTQETTLRKENADRKSFRDEKTLLIMSKEGFIEVLVRVSNYKICLLYTSPSPRDKRQSRMPSSA